MERFNDFVFVVTGEDESAVVMIHSMLARGGVVHHWLCYQLVNDNDFWFTIVLYETVV